MINDSAARIFADLLNSMALSQHVHGATHELGHILDLVITRKSDHLILGEPSPDILFSDHRTLQFQIQTPRPPLKAHEVSFRKIKAIDKDDEFMNDISCRELCSSTTDDPDQFRVLFDKTLRSLLDHHAPVEHKIVTIRPRVPWINDEILSFKRRRSRGREKIEDLFP